MKQKERKLWITQKTNSHFRAGTTKKKQNKKQTPTSELRLQAGTKNNNENTKSKQNKRKHKTQNIRTTTTTTTISSFPAGTTSGCKTNQENTGWTSVDRSTKATLSTYNTWIQVSRLQKIYHLPSLKLRLATTPLAVAVVHMQQGRDLMFVM